MEIINVIVEDAGVISSNTAFILPEKEDDKKATIKAAEELFISKVKEVDDSLTEEELRDSLDDGFYDQDCGNYRSVVLNWPDIYQPK